MNVCNKGTSNGSTSSSASSTSSSGVDAGVGGGTSSSEALNSRWASECYQPARPAGTVDTFSPTRAFTQFIACAQMWDSLDSWAGSINQ